MHRLEYKIAQFLFFLFKRLSLDKGKKFAEILCFFVMNVFRYRRKVVRENLLRVFKEKLTDLSADLERNIYRNFVYLWIELLQINYLKKENIGEHFTYHNLNILDEAIKKGRGVILISGHVGNFEWLGQSLVLMGYKVAGIAKKQSNPLTNDFIEKLRCQHGMKVIYTKSAMSEGLRFLNGNGLLAIATDQDARKRGIFVDFMGIPSSTAIGPAVFHLRTGAAMVFILAIRREYAKFDVYFENIGSDNGGMLNDATIQEITQQHTRILSNWILRYPEQWFWMHRRWKSRPEAAES
jgi:KDO2-lipid IV(A) lauroyltransferase